MAKTQGKTKKRRRQDRAATKATRTSVGAECWCLESAVAGDRGVNRVTIDHFPFRVGRREDLDLTLSSPSISGHHAEFYMSPATGKLCVRDLKSTNGVFLNHERVRDAVLKSGDILHLADIEFRVRRRPCGAAEENGLRPQQTLQLGRNAHRFENASDGTRELLQLINEKAIVPVFQPIVRLPQREIDGYEVLSRGKHPDLTECPSQLLQIAERMGLAPELSRLFRNMALETIGDRDDLPTLFLNTHPDELLGDRVDFIAELRRRAPKQPLVLEIHETALADTDAIRDLQLLLSEHRIGLAFDDFGAGQARVVQLAEVPPDYLKFDRTFVCDIDTAAPSKRHLMSSIVAAAHDLGVCTVAEGVETEDEAEMCTRIGFTHAQGYLFGRPLTLDKL
jgi:EAL domain-containing protein (putative c-di-GMP-specific phosphodiesterase class I)